MWISFCYRKFQRFRETFHFLRGKATRTMRFAQLLSALWFWLFFLRAIKSSFDLLTVQAYFCFFFSSYPFSEGYRWLSNETCICHSCCPEYTIYIYICSTGRDIWRIFLSREKGTIESVRYTCRYEWFMNAVEWTCVHGAARCYRLTEK